MGYPDPRACPAWGESRAGAFGDSAEHELDELSEPRESSQ